MRALPKIVAIITMIAGSVMVVAGTATFLMVRSELADEQIIVADDASNFAGRQVKGPFTAFSQAEVIKDHALDAGGGLTYAQLDRDDPARDTVMNASFLRASLFTSVLAFGVATLLIGLGLVVVLIGLGILALDKRGQLAISAEPAPATGPADTQPIAAA